MSGDTRRESGDAPLLVQERDPGVVALWLNRPSFRNALDRGLVATLTEQFGRADVRAFVLGTSDPRCFCAGADLTLDDGERAEVSERLYELYGVMIAAAPIVVAVDGPAVGGGAQLPVAGDIRLGSPSARFCFPGPGHGLSVGPWGLTSLVGRGRAAEICMTMRTVDAEEALAIGLLNGIDDDPGSRALEMAQTLARLDPAAVARTKAIVREASRLEDALERERSGNAPWSGSVDGLDFAK